MSGVDPAVPPLRQTGPTPPGGQFRQRVTSAPNADRITANGTFPQRAGEGAESRVKAAFAGAKFDDISGTLLGPVRFALLYWAATFVIFLFSNLTTEVRNMGTLVVFVIACFVGFHLGYRAGLAGYLRQRVAAQIPSFGRSSIDVFLVMGGAVYFLMWSLNQLIEFDLTNPVALVQAILNPGEAYKAKFEIAQERLNSQYSSSLGQILVLTSVFYALFVPLVVTSWVNLPRAVRLLALAAIGFYVVSFLAIGTMKGLGDVVLFVLTGISVLIAKRRLAAGMVMSRRRTYLLLSIVGGAFFAYMLVSQVQRAEQFQITESPIVGDVSQSFVAQQFGHDAAYGFYTILAYPSHGYAGLAFSLEQPFVFSRGAGSSLAIESYRQQYMGGGDNRFLTYPFRAEQATGWDAQMFWSTALPWLASDVSFFGVPFLLALLGFVYARLWLAALYGSNPLTVGGLGLMIMFIAFMPANNQVMVSRQGLWAVASLVAVGALVALTRRNRAH